MGTIVIIWAKPCQIECFRSDQKCENHYQIKHVRFSTGTKFHIERTILIFWAKFVLKRYFRSKIEKVNTTIEFSIFTLMQVPNVIWKRQFWFEIITQGKDSFENLIAWDEFNCKFNKFLSPLWYGPWGYSLYDCYVSVHILIFLLLSRYLEHPPYYIGRHFGKFIRNDFMEHFLNCVGLTNTQ